MKLLLAIFLLVAGSALAGEETATYRITGLFSPDREADLRMVLEDIPGVKLVSVDFDHAEAVFSYDPAVAFSQAKPAELKPEEVMKRFENKLRDVSHSTFGVEPLIPTPKDQLTRVEIPIVGLDCKACCLAAYEAVAKIDGVAQATASFHDGRVTALIDPAKTNQQALESALEKKQVKLLKPAPADASAKPASK